MPKFAAATVSIAAMLWLLVEARAVLEPLIIAIFTWFMLNAMASAWTRLVHGPDVAPSGFARGMSAVVFTLVLMLVGMMTASKAGALSAELPAYEARLDGLIASVSSALGLEGTLQIGALMGRIDLSSVVLNAAGTAASFLSTLAIIICYIAFLFVEDNVAPMKLAALYPDPERRTEMAGVLSQINREIETYLGLKLLIGIVQAVPTFVVLTLVGVEAPEFWAVLIFFLSFIPTIGSLAGIILPSLMALLQFDTMGPFLIVLATLLVVQVSASNVLEPRLMGKTLNLSPLAILVAVFAGGAIWGIVGALIVVPFLAIAVIIFARLPSMRPVAVLLSGDGRLHGDAGLDAPGGAGRSERAD